MTEEAEFEAMYRAHADGLIRALAGRGIAEAEEVAAETFYRAWRAWERRPPTLAERGYWLRRIALNAAIDRTRRQRPSEPFELWRHDAGAPAPEQLADFFRLVAPCTPIEQRILFLTYAMRLSVDASAAALGIQRGSVGSIKQRALERLRCRLGVGDLLPHKTHCPRGHAYQAGDARYRCRECQRESARERYRREKQRAALEAREAA